MVVNFPPTDPSAPGYSLTHTEPNGVTWEYDGEKWRVTGGSGGSGGGGGSSYGDDDVDLHLNTASAGNNQVLSWTGTDYGWVNQSAGGGGGDLNKSDADTYYLSKTGPDTAAGAITFEGKTTHEAGVSVTGGDAADIGEGIYQYTTDGLAIVAGGRRVLNVTNDSLYLVSGKNSLSQDETGISSQQQVTNLASPSRKYKAFDAGVKPVGDWWEEISQYYAGDLDNSFSAAFTAGFHSNLSNVTVNASTGVRTQYNFYAEGTAPNYMHGPVVVGKDIQQQVNPLAADATAQTITYASQISICQDGANASNAALAINRTGSTADTTNYIRFNRLGVLIGSVQQASSNTIQYWTGPSDYRLKENIVDLPSATEQIKALRPVDFVFKNAPDEPHVGFIAHEVQEVIPMAASGEKDAVEEYGDLTDADGIVQYDIEKPEAVPFGATFESKGTRIKPQSVNQDKLIPYLTKALQEVIAKNEDLEARIAVLEGN